MQYKEGQVQTPACCCFFSPSLQRISPGITQPYIDRYPFATKQPIMSYQDDNNGSYGSSGEYLACGGLSRRAGKTVLI